MIVVIAQIAIITFLGIRIYEKKSNVLGQYAVNPIKKSEIINDTNGHLKYFYERRPNSEIRSTLPSLGSGIHTINSDTLNERFEYTPQKDEDTFRIITLGDSFTEGVLVDTKSNWSERLEDQLNQRLKCKNIKNFEVINLGVGGYDIEYAVHRYQKRGQKYNPDLLIWFTYPNDFQEIEEIQGSMTVKYNQLYKKENKFSSKNGAYNHRYAAARAQARKDFKAKYEPETIRQYAFNKMTDIHKYFKNKILLISTPNIISEEKALLRKFEAINPELTSIFILPDYESDHIIPKDTHPNEKGHQQIALDIYDKLITQDNIPCKRE